MPNFVVSEIRVMLSRIFVTSAWFAANDEVSCVAALAESIERLQPLSGVHEYPSRVKCATLAWHALNAALDGTKEATSE